MSQEQGNAPGQFTIFHLFGSIGFFTGLFLGIEFGLKHQWLRAALTILVGMPVGVLIGFYGSLFVVIAIVRSCEISTNVLTAIKQHFLK